MILQIITSTTSESIPIEWIELQTSNGSYIIQSGHAPAFFILASYCPVTYQTINKQTLSVLVNHGAMAHVTRTDITIILYSHLQQ